MNYFHGYFDFYKGFKLYLKLEEFYTFIEILFTFFSFFNVQPYP